MTSSPAPIAERLHRQQERIGAVGDAHGVRGAELRGHLLLEAPHLRAEDEPAGVDDVVHCLLDLGQEISVLAMDVHQGNRHEGGV